MSGLVFKVMTFVTCSVKGSQSSLKSLQDEKGSFLQISLCTGTKSVDNILTKIVVIDVLCFILFCFLLVLTYM